jgi:hypothetical protein
MLVLVLFSHGDSLPEEHPAGMTTLGSHQNQPPATSLSHSTNKSKPLMFMFMSDHAYDAYMPELLLRERNNKRRLFSPGRKRERERTRRNEETEPDAGSRDPSHK